jgi:hypothetical protein
MVIVARILEKGDVFHFSRSYSNYKVVRVGVNNVYYRKITAMGYLSKNIYQIPMYLKDKLFLIKDGDFGEVDNLGKIICIKPEQLISLDEC